MYDFSTLTDRSGVGSLKWNVKDGELPMWVADMDFRTAPEVESAIYERIKAGCYGYTEVTDDWYEAYISWWKNRHDFLIDKKWLLFSTGVVPTVSSVVRKLTYPAEKVLIQTPVYNIFFNSIYNNGRYIFESPLFYKDGNYSIDWNDLEDKLSDKQTSLMILCNPHNPVGRIWSCDELERIGELCHKYNVAVLSDEIHCDLTAPGKAYTPFASVSDICRNISITAISASKSFNLAGIQSSAIIVPNPELRHKVWRGINTDEIAEPNILATVSAVAALNKGGKWLDELRVYLWDNRRYAEEYIQSDIPSIKLIKADATYLMWVDCSELCDDTEELSAFIRAKSGLYITAGAEYGESGKAFLRINLATQRERLIDGLERLKRSIELFH